MINIYKMVLYCIRSSFYVDEYDIKYTDYIVYDKRVICVQVNSFRGEFRADSNHHPFRKLALCLCVCVLRAGRGGGGLGTASYLLVPSFHVHLVAMISHIPRF